MNIMNLEEYKGVYVFAEQVDNKLSGIAFELLGKAKDLAADLNAEVAAVLIGSDVKGLADELNWLRQHGIQLRIADIPMTMRCSDETEQRLASEMLYQVIDATVLKDREEKRQKQSEGIRAAQEKGVHIGRKPMERGAEFETLKQQWQRGEVSLREAGRRLGVTHQTFKKWVEEPDRE